MEKVRRIVTIHEGKEFSSSTEEQQIHAQLLNKLAQNILSNFDKQNLDNFACNYPSGNLNYLVMGARGSGKSTFLKNILGLLVNNNKGVHLRTLLEYDPSASNGSPYYFFSSVYIALKTELNQLYACKCTSHVQPRLEECRKYEKELDKGISRLTNNKQPLSELTETVISLMRLNSPWRDEYVRDVFDRLVNAMCDMLCIKAFIVTVDDSDTSSHQCMRVLESLRLFVTHPKIIILMTGDRKMLLERIREHHFKEFNIDYHRSETERHSMRMEAIVSHASQYLLKLFPANNQHELQNLLLLSQKRFPVELYVDQLALREYVKQALLCTISEVESEIDSFVQLFLCLPLRAILQITRYWNAAKLIEQLEKIQTLKKKIQDEQNVIKKKTDEIKSEIGRCLETPECERKSFGTDSEEIESLISKLQKISDKNEQEKTKTEGIKKLPFVKKGIDSIQPSIEELEQLKSAVAYSVRIALKRTLQIELQYHYFDSLMSDNGRTFFSLMLKHCQDMGDLEHGYYLSGDMGVSKEDKYMSMLLAVSFKQNVEGLDGFLSSLLYGPATVTLYAKAVEQFRRSPRALNITTQEKLRACFAEYMHVGSWQSATRWARHANMIWCHDPGFEGLHSGILRLRSRKEIDNLNTCIQAWTKKTTSDGSPEVVSVKKAMAVVISTSRSAERDNSYFISVYSFIAFILKCLSICKKLNGDEVMQKKEIRKALMKCWPIKSCLNPEWLINKQKGSKKEDGNHALPLTLWDIPLPNSRHVQKNAIKAVRIMAEEIVSWCNTTINKENNYSDDLSPSKMGEVWSDFYYSIKQISHSSTTDKKNPLLAIDHISKFYKVIEYFESTFCIPDDELDATDVKLSEFYRNRITHFPLLSSLKEAICDFENKTVQNYHG